MAPVDTAGSVVTESELRAFARCRRYHWYGGEHEEPIGVKILRLGYEATLSDVFRKEGMGISTAVDVDRKIVSAAFSLTRFKQLLEPQQNRLMSKMRIAMSEVLRAVPLDIYQVASPPKEYRVRVSKTPVDLHVSGVLRSERNMTLHVIDFSPYTYSHNVRNDPIATYKAATFGHLVEDHPRRKADVLIHLFGLNNNDEFTYSTLADKSMDKKHLRGIKGLVQSMERGDNYPVVPCRFSCPFKSRCKPEMP